MELIVELKKRIALLLKSFAKGFKIKKKNIFKKACEFKKKLYFCSRLPGQPLGLKGMRKSIEDTFIDILN